MPTTNGDIVRAYLDAFYHGDVHAARRYLADDLSFAGPNATFHSADDYLRVTAHVAAGVRAVELQHLFVDGPDVAAFYDLLVEQAVERMPVAERFQVRDGRIAHIQMIFDTAPFLPQPRRPPAEMERDPVCGMTVQRASAAATRQYAGTTYAFCAPACAAAFDAEPAVYAARRR
jgi:YHS domain-containing protein/ketosteroid isomerase-like protein